MHLTSLSAPELPSPLSESCLSWRGSPCPLVFLYMCLRTLWNRSSGPRYWATMEAKHTWALLWSNCTRKVAPSWPCSSTLHAHTWPTHSHCPWWGTQTLCHALHCKRAMAAFLRTYLGNIFFPCSTLRISSLVKKHSIFQPYQVLSWLGMSLVWGCSWSLRHLLCWLWF